MSSPDDYDHFYNYNRMHSYSASEFDDEQMLHRVFADYQQLCDEYEGIELKDKPLLVQAEIKRLEFLLENL